MITTDLVGSVGVTVGGYTLASDLATALQVPTCLGDLKLSQSTETTAVAAGPASLTFDALYPEGWPLPQLGHIVEMAASPRSSRQTRRNVFAGFVDSVEVVGTMKAGPLVDERRIPVPAFTAPGWVGKYRKPNSSTWSDVQRLDATAHDLTAWATAAVPDEDLFAGQAVRFWSPPFQWAAPAGAPTGQPFGFVAVLAASILANYGTSQFFRATVMLQRWATGATPATTPDGYAASFAATFPYNDAASITGNATNAEGIMAPAATTDPGLLDRTDWNKGNAWRVCVELKREFGRADTGRPCMTVAGLRLHWTPSYGTDDALAHNARQIATQRRQALTRVKVTASDPTAWGARTRVGFPPLMSRNWGDWLASLRRELDSRFVIDLPVGNGLTFDSNLGPLDADSQAPWDIQQRVSAAAGLVPYPALDLYERGGQLHRAAFDPRRTARKPQIEFSRYDQGIGTMPRKAALVANVITAAAASPLYVATVPASNLEFRECLIDGTGLSNEVKGTFKRGALLSVEAADETVTYRDERSATEFGPSGIAVDSLLSLKPGAAKTGPLFDKLSRVLTAQSQPRYRVAGPLTVVKGPALLPDGLHNYLGNAGTGRALVITGAPSWMGGSHIVKGTDVVLGPKASLVLETEPEGYNGARPVTFGELRLLPDRSDGKPASFVGCSLTSKDLRGLAAPNA